MRWLPSGKNDGANTKQPNTTNAEANIMHQNELNHVIHGIAGNLKRYGITLEDGQVANLNGLMIGFLKSQCGTSIDPTDRKYNEIEIKFNILYGTAFQTIHLINEEYNKESVTEGLECGKLATTAGHEDGSRSEVIVVATGEVIGLVVYQEIDGEYEEFCNY